MNYDELLVYIEVADTCCELEELRTEIAESCDDGEITNDQYFELRKKCESRMYDLPTRQALEAEERDDLNHTYYQQIKI